MNFLMKTHKKKALCLATRERTRLGCPRCDRRVIDKRPDIHTELHIVKGGDDWPADYYMKCPHCRTEIGIRRIA